MEWSEDEIETLTLYLAGDETYAEIADVLGRSKRAVQHMARKIGRRQQSPTSEPCNIEQQLEQRLDACILVSVFVSGVVVSAAAIVYAQLLTK